MAELRRIDLPEHIRDIYELEDLDRVSDKQILRLESEIEALENDVLIATASEKGIARREEILGIKPLDGKILEQRRARVMAEWYDPYPYTRLSLERKMSLICGEGHFTISVNAQAQTMYITLDLWAMDKKEDVVDMLERILPLQIAYSIEIIYNRWNKYLPQRWQKEKPKTWKIMKEGIE